ncbi:hypothetical protein JJQ59_00200 [Cupriavidus necator]|uniref:Uncharacterized protein n=1 Tax=Cupriavidus necator TaxID=106590 RepID=A0A367P972_CUPNE|nr:hypothetical protein [Cupriavidus necator]QQX84445.1 hypothetical protein JJQ59_00200 [Cupriavidus necator]RCJ03606.1 hypothetical protein DDK22_36365 [Cupriavidus necator]
MTRLSSRLAACIAFGLLLAASAQASDIACKTTLRRSRCDDPLAAGTSCLQSVPHAADLICDHAMLQREHERIHADQQRRLRAGAIHRSDIAAWRERRDACTSVTCLDRVFASWRRQPDKKPPQAAAPQPTPPAARAREAPKNKQAAVTVEASRPAAAPPPATQPVAEQPPALPPAEPLAQPGMQAPPVVIQRASGPTPQQASIRPTLAPQPRGWTSLGTLAWLSMCSAGVACWSRRTRGEWLPGVTRLRERTRDAPPIVLLVSGLLALNGVLLLCVLAGSRPFS